MPSFLKQLTSLPGQLLGMGKQLGRTKASQAQAKALQAKLAQLPAGGEQVDISERATITPTGPVVPPVLGTPAAVAPQPGVAPTPAAPTVGMAEGVPTVPGEAEAAPPLGITREQIDQYRELMGQQQTPEMLEEKRKSQELLEQLIPFRQQLAQAEAPTEAMVELDAQIAGLKRQIKRTTPEAFESTLGRTKGFGAAMAAKQAAPIQAEVTELLFQRSAIGQRRAAEAERAQAGITAIGEEMDIRKAMAQLDQPAELPAGIQTKIFERAFPGPAKAPSISEQIRLSETYGVGFGTPTSELLGRRPIVKPTTQQKREQGYEVIGELVETTPGGTYEELFATARRQAPNLTVGDVKAALEEAGVIKGGSNLTDEILQAIAQEQWDIVLKEEGWFGTSYNVFENTASLQKKTLAALEGIDELTTEEGEIIKLSRQQRMKINEFVKLLKK